MTNIEQPPHIGNTEFVIASSNEVDAEYYRRKIAELAVKAVGHAVVELLKDIEKLRFPQLENADCTEELQLNKSRIIELEGVGIVSDLPNPIEETLSKINSKDRIEKLKPTQFRGYELSPWADPHFALPNEQVIRCNCNGKPSRGMILDDESSNFHGRCIRCGLYPKSSHP